MNKEKIKFYCPDCKKELDSVKWGQKKEKDFALCVNCGFWGALNTSTGYNEDGSMYQNKVE